MSNYNNGYGSGSKDLAPFPTLGDFENDVDFDDGDLPVPEPDSDMDVEGFLNSSSRQAHAARSGGLGDFPDFHTWVTRNNSSAAQNNATTNKLACAPDMTNSTMGLPSLNYGGLTNRNGPYELDHTLLGTGMVNSRSIQPSNPFPAPADMARRYDPFASNIGGDLMQGVPAQEVRGSNALSNTQDAWTRDQLSRMNTQIETMATQMAAMRTEMASANQVAELRAQVVHVRTHMASATAMAELRAQVADLQTQIDTAAQVDALRAQVANMQAQMGGLAGAAALANGPNPAARPMAMPHSNANNIMNNTNAAAVPGVMAPVNDGPKKANTTKGRKGSVTITVYRLMVDASSTEWQEKLKREIPLPLKTQHPEIASVLEGVLKTRSFAQGAVSLKVKYKAESLSEDGQFDVVDVDELPVWLSQVRPECDWAVNAFVYEEAGEQHAADDLLP